MGAERQCRPRIGQVLDDVEQNDNVHRSELRKSHFIGNSSDNAQSSLATRSGGTFRKLDTSDFVKRLSFLQKEPIGTAYVEKASVGLLLSHKLHRTGEFAPQYIFGALVICISVSAPAGEIVNRIVFVRVEVSGFSSAKSTLHALPNCALILCI